MAIEAQIGAEPEPVQQRLLETVAEIWAAESSTTPETDCETLRAYHRQDALVKNVDRAVKAITRGDIDGAECILASAAAARSGPEDQRPPWPTLDERALHGLAGEVVRTIGPQSEADPVAILVQYVIAFGSVIGRTAHYKVEGSRHYTNLYGVLVGETAKARKGTAWDRVLEIVGGLDEDWNRQGGLSTGEGLIHLVRDAVTKAKRDKDGELVEQTEDEGVSDKRLLVVEPEFTRTLRAQSRDGNILSQVLREAWDSGNLATATRSSPLRATEAHISIIGHAVRDELVGAMSNNDVVGGTANRIQFFVVRRSKRLPHGGSLPEAEVRRLQERTQQAVAAARRLGRMQLDAAARDLWESVYDVLSEGRTGQVGRVTARAEAQAMRLSVIYAALDASQVIREVHLRAALALWTFADISAQWIFGTQTGSSLADKIRDAVRAAPDGISLSDVWQLTARHGSKLHTENAIRLLEATGEVRRDSRATGGRPAVMLVAIRPTDVPQTSFASFASSAFAEPPVTASRDATKAKEGAGHPGASSTPREGVEARRQRMLDRIAADRARVAAEFGEPSALVDCGRRTRQTYEPPHWSRNRDRCIVARLCLGGEVAAPLGAPQPLGTLLRPRRVTQAHAGVLPWAEPQPRSRTCRVGKLRLFRRQSHALTLRGSSRSCTT